MYLITSTSKQVLPELVRKDTKVAKEYSDVYVPNKTWTLFRDVVFNPGDGGKAPSTVCDPTTSVRLEVTRDGLVDLKVLFLSLSLSLSLSLLVVCFAWSLSLSLSPWVFGSWVGLCGGSLWWVFVVGLWWVLGGSWVGLGWVLDAPLS
jgi:hypothetical protein